MGPNESAPVMLSWPLVYHLPPFLIWLLPPAAILLLKENRHAKALAVAIPLLAIGLLWASLRWILVHGPGVQSASLLDLDVFITGALVSLSLWLLLAHRLSANDRPAVALLAWLLMVGTFALTTWAFLGTGPESIWSAGVLAIIAAIVTGALVLTGFCCRKRYYGLKFALWLAAWCIVFSFAVVFPLCIFMLLLMRPAGMLLALLLLGNVLLAGQLGIGLYIMLLPFIILVANSAFYRQRFYACFRLKGMLADQPPAPGAHPDPARQS